MEVKISKYKFGFLFGSSCYVCRNYYNWYTVHLRINHYYVILKNQVLASLEMKCLHSYTLIGCVPCYLLRFPGAVKCAIGLSRTWIYVKKSERSSSVNRTPTWVEGIVGAWLRSSPLVPWLVRRSPTRATVRKETEIDREKEGKGEIECVIGRERQREGGRCHGASFGSASYPRRHWRHERGAPAPARKAV